MTTRRMTGSRGRPNWRENVDEVVDENRIVCSDGIDVGGTFALLAGGDRGRPDDQDRDTFFSALRPLLV